MSKQTEQNNLDALAPQLIEAISDNKIETVQALIKQGVDVNKGSLCQNPLYCAAAKGYTHITLELVKHGANPKTGSKQDYDALTYAALQGGYTNEMSRLIEEAPVINLLYLHPPKGDSSLSTTELELLKNKLNNMSFADLQEIYSLKNITDNTLISHKKCLMNLVDAETSKEVDRVFRELTHKNIPFVDILRTLQTYTPEDTKNYTELNKKYQEINKLIDVPLDYILAQLKECNEIIENIKLDFVAGKEEAAKCLEYIALQYSEIKNLKLSDFENLKEGITALNIEFKYAELPQTIEEHLVNLNVSALEYVDEVAVSVVGASE